MFRLVRFWTGLVSVAFHHLAAISANWRWRSACAPGFACHGCLWSTFACPVGVLTFGSAVRLLPALALGTVLAVGGLFGRLVCGFACPFGWLQDVLHKIPSPKIRLPRAWRYGKYAALVLLVFAFPYFLGMEAGDGLDVKYTVTAGVDDEDDADAFLPLPMDEEDEDWLTELAVVPGDEPEVRYRVDIVVTNRGDSEAADPSILLFRIVPPETEESIPLPDGRAMKVAASSTWPKPIPPGGTIEDSVWISSETGEAVTAEGLIVRALPGGEIRSLFMPRYELYFCRLCPKGTLTAHIPGYFRRTTDIYGEGVTVGARAWGGRWRLAIFGAFLVLAVISSRPFCRGMCPLGAMYGLCARLGLVRIGVDKDACVGCGLCDKVCPVDLDVRNEVGGAECIACGDCARACPGSAIRRSIGPR